VLKALGRWPDDSPSQNLTLKSLTSRVRDVLVKTTVLDHIESAFSRRSDALAEGRPVIVGRQLTADELSAPVIAQFPAPVRGAEGVPCPGTAARPGTVSLDLSTSSCKGSGAVLATIDAVERCHMYSRCEVSKTQSHGSLPVACMYQTRYKQQPHGKLSESQTGCVENEWQHFTVTLPMSSVLLPLVRALCLTVVLRLQAPWAPCVLREDAAVNLRWAVGKHMQTRGKLHCRRAVVTGGLQASSAHGRAHEVHLAGSHHNSTQIPVLVTLTAPFTPLVRQRQPCRHHRPPMMQATQHTAPRKACSRRPLMQLGRHGRQRTVRHRPRQAHQLSPAPNARALLSLGNRQTRSTSTPILQECNPRRGSTHFAPPDHAAWQAMLRVSVGACSPSHMCRGVVDLPQLALHNMTAFLQKPQR
jgi:hypothetical protein